MANTHTKKFQKITMRELLRNSKSFRKALEAGVGFELYLRNKKIAKISPSVSKKTRDKKYTREDFFKNIVGSIKDKPGLSNEDIDKIVYEY